MKRVNKVKKQLRMLGLNPERVAFYNLSAAQGPRWAEICTEFTKTINVLGPSPLWFALRQKQAQKAEQQAA